MLGAALDGTAGLLFLAEKPEEARPLLEDAIRHQERAVTLAPHVDQYRFLAGHHTNLAAFHSVAQRSDEAVQSFEAGDSDLGELGQ